MQQTVAAKPQNKNRRTFFISLPNEPLSDGQEPALTSELASDANGSCPFAGAVCWLPGDRLSRTRPKNYRCHPMYVIVRRAPEATAPAALLPCRARHTRSLPGNEPFRSAYPYGRESQARAATAPAHRRGH